MMFAPLAALLSTFGLLAGAPPPAEQNPTPPDQVGVTNATPVGQWLTLPVAGLRFKAPKGPAARAEVSGLVDGTGPRLLAQDGLRFLDDGGRTPAMATVEVGVPDCDHLTKPGPWGKARWLREDRPVDNGRIAVILCRAGMNQEWLMPSADAASAFDAWTPWVEALADAWTRHAIDAKVARVGRAMVFVQEPTPSGAVPLGPPPCAFGADGYAKDCLLAVPRLGLRLALGDLWYVDDPAPADPKAAPPAETTLRLAVPAATQLSVVLRKGSACSAAGRSTLPTAQLPKGWRVLATPSGAAAQAWRLCLERGAAGLTADVTSVLPPARVPEYLWPLLAAIEGAASPP